MVCHIVIQHGEQRGCGNTARERIGIGGYPLDSGSPYRLWFGFGLRGGRVNYPMMGNRIDGHSLLRQTKEDLASTL